MRPVMDNAEITGILEKTINIINNHQVKIKEQRRPCQVAQLRRKQSNFAPRQILMRFRQWQMRHGESLNTRVQIGCIIRKTNKPMRQCQMPLHHRIQPVSIIRPIFSTPFSADYVYFFLHHILFMSLRRMTGSSGSYECQTRYENGVTIIVGTLIN